MNTSSPVANVLDRLQNVKRNGSGWMASCPAHDDRKASLHVDEGRDGKVLLYCHAGCDLQAILSHLEVPMNDLFSQPPLKGNGRITATYDYHDAEGRVMYQSVRKEPKDFYQRRPDGRGGWIHNLKDTQRVLYRLPDLLEANPKRWVFVVEGEKDADRLHSLGLLATTNPQGAGKWREEYNEVLAGRKVVILPDNDEAGRKHAAHVALSLSGHVESIKVVALPGLSEKGDVSDWLDGGGSVEQLRELVSAAPILDDIHENLNNLNDVNQDNLDGVVCLADVVAEPIDWLWNDLIARGKFGIWEGDPGVGKTYALMAVGACITNGKGLPDMPQTEPQNVLLMTLEDDLADTIKPRAVSLLADTTRFYACDRAIQIDDAGIAWLSDKIAKVKPALVILDPIMAYIPGNIDIYKPNQVRRITTPLSMLAKEHGCAIVGIRHLTKSQKDRAIYRGAGGMDFVGASRLMVLVGRDPDNPNKCAIVQTKTNVGNPGRAVGYTIEGGEFYWTGESSITADRILTADPPGSEKSAVDEAAEFLTECLTPFPRNSRDVFKEAIEVSITIPTLRKAKKRLGVIVTRHGEKGKQGGGSWYWSLPGLGIKDDEPEDEVPGFDSLDD